MFFCEHSSSCGTLGPMKAWYSIKAQTEVDVEVVNTISIGAPTSPWNVIKSASHIPANSQSDESYRNIRKWIMECTMKHQICPSNDSTPLPKRLIDISDGQNPKLYESAGESGRSQPFPTGGERHSSNHSHNLHAANAGDQMGRTSQNFSGRYHYYSPGWFETRLDRLAVHCTR
jgi:hypothetical protein